MASEEAFDSVDSSDSSFVDGPSTRIPLLLLLMVGGQEIEGKWGCRSHCGYERVEGLNC